MCECERYSCSLEDYDTSENNSCNKNSKGFWFSQRYKWKCAGCGFEVPINSETYELFFEKAREKARCPKCADKMIVVEV